MKNVFDGLICRFDKTKEINSKLDDSSIEITQTKTQKEKRVKQIKKQEASRAVGQYQKVWYAYN